MIYNHKEIDAKWQKIITKSIIFSFLILMFGNYKIFAQKNDWEKENLKGKVKSVLKIDYKLKKSSETTFQKSTHLKNAAEPSNIQFLYNSNGFITQEIKYYKPLLLEQKKTEIVYLDKQMKSVEKYPETSPKSREIDPKKKAQNDDDTTRKYYFYEGNKKVREELFDRGEFNRKFLFYDDEQIFKKMIENAELDVFYILLDENGNRVEEFVINNHYKYHKKIGYEYDEKGYIHIVMRELGKDYHKDVYQNDDYGNPLQIDYFALTEEEEKHLATIICTYNEYRDKITESRIVGGSTKLTFEESGTANFRWTYIYDSQGNWLERIGYVNEIPFQFTERKIEYY